MKFNCLVFLILIVLSLKVWSAGSIYRTDNGGYSYSFNSPNTADADRFAFNECRKTSNNCKKILNYDYGCSAVAEVEINGRYYWSRNYQSKDSAEQRALEECKKDNPANACRIPLSICDSNQSSNNQANQNAQEFSGRCSSYGFQPNTDGFANCLMQFEQAQRQIDAQNQQRIQLEQRCNMAKSQAWFAPTRTGNFVESAQNAAAAYSRCMAGLPPARSYMINCNQTGSNFICYAQ